MQKIYLIQLPDPDLFYFPSCGSKPLIWLVMKWRFHTISGSKCTHTHILTIESLHQFKASFFSNSSCLSFTILVYTLCKEFPMKRASIGNGESIIFHRKGRQPNIMHKNEKKCTEWGAPISSTSLDPPLSDEPRYFINAWGLHNCDLEPGTSLSITPWRSLLSGHVCPG